MLIVSGAPISGATPRKRRVDYEGRNLTLIRRLISGSDHSVITYDEVNKFSGWRAFVCSQVRGKTDFERGYIVIPAFIWDPEDPHGIGRIPDGLPEWYVSHELAHVLAPDDGHGDQFMRYVKAICPDYALHFEQLYKPRNAAAAGINAL